MRSLLDGNAILRPAPSGDSTSGGMMDDSSSLASSSSSPLFLPSSSLTTQSIISLTICSFISVWNIWCFYKSTKAVWKYLRYTKNRAAGGGTNGATGTSNNSGGIIQNNNSGGIATTTTTQPSSSTAAFPRHTRGKSLHQLHSSQQASSMTRRDTLTTTSTATTLNTSSLNIMQHRNSDIVTYTRAAITTTSTLGQQSGLNNQSSQGQTAITSVPSSPAIPIVQHLSILPATILSRTSPASSRSFGGGGSVHHTGTLHHTALTLRLTWFIMSLLTTIGMIPNILSQVVLVDDLTLLIPPSSTTITPTSPSSTLGGRYCQAFCHCMVFVYGSTKFCCFLFYFAKNRAVRPHVKWTRLEKVTLACTFLTIPSTLLGVILSTGVSNPNDQTCEMFLPSYIFVIQLIGDVGLSTVYLYLFVMPLKETIERTSEMVTGRRRIDQNGQLMTGGSGSGQILKTRSMRNLSAHGLRGGGGNNSRSSSFIQNENRNNTKENALTSSPATIATSGLGLPPSPSPHPLLPSSFPFHLPPTSSNSTTPRASTNHSILHSHLGHTMRQPRMSLDSSMNVSSQQQSPSGMQQMVVPDIAASTVAASTIVDEQLGMRKLPEGLIQMIHEHNNALLTSPGAVLPSVAISSSSDVAVPTPIHPASTFITRQPSPPPLVASAIVALSRQPSSSSPSQPQPHSSPAHPSSSFLQAPSTPEMRARNRKLSIDAGVRRTTLNQEERGSIFTLTTLPSNPSSRVTTPFLLPKLMIPTSSSPSIQGSPTNESNTNTSGASAPTLGLGQGLGFSVGGVASSPASRSQNNNGDSPRGGNAGGGSTVGINPMRMTATSGFLTRASSTSQQQRLSMQLHSTTALSTQLHMQATHTQTPQQQLSTQQNSPMSRVASMPMHPVVNAAGASHLAIATTTSARDISLVHLMRKNILSYALSTFITICSLTTLMIGYAFQIENMKKLTQVLGAIDLAVSCATVWYLMKKTSENGSGSSHGNSATGSAAGSRRRVADISMVGLSQMGASGVNNLNNNQNNGGNWSPKISAVGVCGGGGGGNEINANGNATGSHSPLPGPSPLGSSTTLVTRVPPRYPTHRLSNGLLGLMDQSAVNQSSAATTISHPHRHPHHQAAVSSLSHHVAAASAASAQRHPSPPLPVHSPSSGTSVSEYATHGHNSIFGNPIEKVDSSLLNTTMSSIRLNQPILRTESPDQPKRMVDQFILSPFEDLPVPSNTTPPPQILAAAAAPVSHAQQHEHVVPETIMELVGGSSSDSSETSSVMMHHPKQQQPEEHHRQHQQEQQQPS